MTQIVWDNVGARVYESGIDRGVLYPPNAPGVAWNGLTGVVEDRSSGAPVPFYLDGVKYLDDKPNSDYAATLTAFTYPKEFQIFDGLALSSAGLYFDHQPSSLLFGMSYRTKIGTDANAAAGYRLHLLYNLTATPTQKTYKSDGSEISPLDFSWALTGIPVAVPGFRPTCHAFLDSRETSPAYLASLEAQLYGTASVAPVLPPLGDIKIAVY